MIKTISKKHILGYTAIRTGEQKLGEKIECVDQDWEETLKISSAKYALLGISEDIGVRGNLGKPGTASSWKPFLKSFLNVQHNEFLDGKNILVLGQLKSNDLSEICQKNQGENETQLTQLRETVAKLDDRLSYVMQQICAAGKIPIVIGGGHNNCYGNIKGTSLALSTPINVINCDPHTDFRALEGRHSGNGFSYAMDEGYLSNYAMVGLHESYTSQAILNRLEAFDKKVFTSYYDEVFIREEISWRQSIQKGINFVKSNISTGIELDIDAIENAPSSAQTPSGIGVNQARFYVYQTAKKLTPAYLHLAEAAPELGQNPAQVGKLLAYLVADFIKGAEA